MRIVIIGNGPAAIAAAETIRGRDSDSVITMVSREGVPFYSPCPLAEYVEGSVPKERLFLRDKGFYAANRIETRFGHGVERIDTESRQVHAGGAAIIYDRLLIASGAKAFMPPLPGLETAKGVFALKTLADAESILERIGSVRRAVVIGSGFIGLEAAQALVRRNLEVTVLEARDQVLPTMLDAEMAAIVEKRLTEHGVRVRTKCSAEAVLEGENGVRAVRVGGEEIACELVICAAGVRADLSILEGSHIATGRGILVDDRMRTNVADVFAAGDIIERTDGPESHRILPNWPNAVSTGLVAGWNMMGVDRKHPGLEAVNVVRIFGLPVSSFGAQSGGAVQRWQAAGAVRKVLVEDGRVIGGQMIGEVNNAGVLHEMMKKKVPVDDFGPALADPAFGYAQTLRPVKAVVGWA